jgi:NAD-dependent deacetylase
MSANGLSTELLECLRARRRIAVLTGAGISAESGLPTFRGAGGIWNPVAIRRFATPSGFAKAPRRAWEWYEFRRGEVLKAGPNAGHRAFAEWDARLTADGGWLEIFTQNIDGLHQQAGSKRVTELHGSAWTLRCTRCGRRRVERTHPLPRRPPRCLECGGLERPGVVFFGEKLPEDALEKAKQVASDCDLFITAGTSAMVNPAASLVLIATQAGIPTLEVNIDVTPLSSHVKWSIRGTTGQVLPLLVQASEC